MAAKKQNQTTEEQKDENAQGQPAENQQTENPAQNGGGNGDVQPSATPPANADTNGGNADDKPTDTPPADNQPTETPTGEQPKSGDDGKTDGADAQPPAPPALPQSKKGETDSEPKKEKTVTLTLRHKSHTPHYHRCGLTLTKTWAEYEVSEESAARLKADKWVEVKK